MVNENNLVFREQKLRNQTFSQPLGGFIAYIDIIPK